MMQPKITQTILTWRQPSRPPLWKSFQWCSALEAVLLHSWTQSFALQSYTTLCILSSVKMENHWLQTSLSWLWRPLASSSLWLIKQIYSFSYGLPKLQWQLLSITAREKPHSRTKASNGSKKKAAACNTKYVRGMKCYFKTSMVLREREWKLYQVLVFLLEKVPSRYIFI